MVAEKAKTTLFGEYFKGKRFYRMLSARKSNPLSFHERMTYSYVVYRTAKGGTTISEISKATGIDRRKKIPAVIRRLIEERYMAREGRGIVALPPPDESVWVWRKRTDKWYHDLIGSPILHTAKGWTPKQLGVYCCLFTNNVQEGRRILPHQKKKGIASMLKVSHDTVQTTWRKLESLGLLEYDYLRQPSAEILATFEDRPTQHQGEWQASVATGWDFGEWRDGPLMANLIDRYSKLMLKAKYTKDEVISYWEGMADEANLDVPVMYDFLMEWDTMFQRVENLTSQSRRDGKFTGRNSLGKLTPESERAISQIRANKRNVKDVK